MACTSLQIQNMTTLSRGAIKLSFMVSCLYSHRRLKPCNFGCRIQGIVQSLERNQRCLSAVQTLHSRSASLFSPRQKVFTHDAAYIRNNYQVGQCFKIWWPMQKQILIFKIMICDEQLTFYGFYKSWKRKSNSGYLFFIRRKKCNIL